VTTYKSLDYFRTFHLFFQKIIKKYFAEINAKKFVWIIILLGIIFRLSQYLFNRSLWLDEAKLALNIVDKNYSDFLKPLAHNQAAPVGFLFLEKFSIQILGNSDITLRLVPFCAGILSLILFYKVASYNLTKRGTIIALGLFSISDPLIYYSSELKQYSSDVAVTLLLLLGTYLIIEKKSGFYFTIAGLLGAVLLWFSHPAIFILAGMGISLGIYFLVKKDIASLVRLTFVILIWLISFIILYSVALKYIAHDQFMLNYWAEGFIPNNFFSTEIIFWIWKNTVSTFQYPVGLFFAGLGVLTFIIGFLFFFKYKKFKLTILISCILVTILVSVLHKYPFEGRLILFLVPIFLIIIGEGIDKLFKGNLVNSNTIGILVILILCVYTCAKDIQFLYHPRTREEIKSVMLYLNQNVNKGDTIYLFPYTSTPFEYYASRFGFSSKDYIIGIGLQNNQFSNADELNKYIGKKRFWIVFTDITPFLTDGKEIYLTYLQRNGKELKSFSAPGASAYLFNLETKK
jgi:hypothetical protein